MNILNKLTIKHLKMNKRRTIVTIIGIILSTALMVGIGTIASSIREYFITDAIERSGTTHVIIKNVPIDKVKYIENNINVDKNKTYFTSEIGYAIINSKNDYKPYIYLKNIDKFNNIKLIDGVFPKNSNEVVISEHTNSNGQANIKIGDEIKLELGKRVLVADEKITLSQKDPYQKEEEILNEKLLIQSTKTYKVVGIIERLKSEYYSSPGYTALTINNEQLNKIEAFIEYKQIKNVHKKTKEIASVIKDDSLEIDYNEALLSQYAESSYSNINNFLVRMIIVVLTLLIVACSIVIYNSFAISVMERKKQFGLFSSIGSTSKQLRKTVFFEAFIVSLIGIPLGVLGGIFGIYITMIVINNLLVNELPHALKLSLYPTFIIIPIIYMIITIIISVFLPAKRAAKISPVEAIRLNDDIKIKKKDIKSNKLVLKLGGIESDLAYKNIRRNKGKYLITVISLVISIILFIGFNTFLGVSTKSARNTLQLKDYDILVTFDYKTTDEEFNNYINKISSIKEIDNLKTIRDYTINLNISNKNISKNVKSINNETYIVANEPELVRSEFQLNQLIVMEIPDKEFAKLADNLELSNNDLILYNNFKLSTRNKTVLIKPFDNLDGVTLTSLEENNSKKLKLNNKIILVNKVSNYINDLIANQESSLIAFAKKSTLKEFETKIGKYLEDDHDGYTPIISKSLEIKTKKHLLTEEKINKILKQDKDSIDEKNIAYITNEAKSKESQRNSMLVISILLYGFISLVTLIGVTSVFNTITTSMALRRKEFAVLRSIGLTPKQFTKMISFESIFYGLKALLYGLPLGLFVSLIFNYLLKDLNSGGGLLIPTKAIIITIVAVFIIVSLTMKYATSKQKKENILDVIRQENI